MSDRPSYLPAELEQQRDEELSRAPAQLEKITDADWARWMSERGPGFYRPRTKPHFKLIDGGKLAWAGKHVKDCGQCANTHMQGDPRRGWCASLSFLVSLASPVLCKNFKPR